MTDTSSLHADSPEGRDNLTAVYVGNPPASGDRVLCEHCGLTHPRAMRPGEHCGWCRGGWAHRAAVYLAGAGGAEWALAAVLATVIAVYVWYGAHMTGVARAVYWTGAAVAVVYGVWMWRLHGNPGYDEPAFCEACESPEVALVTDDIRRVTLPEIFTHPTWLRTLAHLCAPQVNELTTWCTDHAAQSVRSGVESAHYWMPTPAAITWRQADTHTATEQPGCYRCGGTYGPTRYAVWGDDDDATWGEGYCARCMATPTTWTDGCTYADLGANQYSIPAYEAAMEAAFDRRILIPAELIMSAVAS